MRSTRNAGSKKVGVPTRHPVYCAQTYIGAFDYAYVLLRPLNSRLAVNLELKRTELGQSLLVQQIVHREGLTDASHPESAG